MPAFNINSVTPSNHKSLVSCESPFDSSFSDDQDLRVKYLVKHLKSINQEDSFFHPLYVNTNCLWKQIEDISVIASYPKGS